MLIDLGENRADQTRRSFAASENRRQVLRALGLDMISGSVFGASCRHDEDVGVLGEIAESVGGHVLIGKFHGYAVEVPVQELLGTECSLVSECVDGDRPALQRVAAQ